MEDQLPLYGVEDEPPAPPVLRVREVVDLVVEMLLLGAVFGRLLGAGSNYLKLLLVPLGIFAWVLVRRLVGLCARIFSASTPSSPAGGG